MRYLILTLAFTTAMMAADDPYTPLRLYQGTWKAAASHPKPGVKPDELIDECGQVGMYFLCQQTVNGTPAALLVFVPADHPGHYYTTSVSPKGDAGGGSDLEIAGSRWVYSSKSENGGKTTYHRVVNQFTGSDRIHFEISESSDGEHWTVTRSGDEARVK
ncbi:MAG TPA: hypothetical protein VGS58_03455 [Candidatus Sulfopaludibacter sp.]|nr:hypothetical protein [Candidatus Sulfopaludibacter sp.]